VVKVALSTKNLGLKMKPMHIKDKWNVVVYNDSDWGGDPETRGSVTGIAVFVNRCLVSWISKAQMAISLSSSEAEWYAQREGSKGGEVHCSNTFDDGCFHTTTCRGKS
jgi:hypothetical protein